MKKNLLLLLAVCMGVCGCQQREEDVLACRTITFRCSEPDLHVDTRASLSEASLTDLWLWEGSTLLAHQTSSDSDFGSPSVTLAYGTHNLTFVASAAEGQGLSEGVWSCSKVKDMFGLCKEVTVDGSTASSITAELSRRVAKVLFTTTDNVPSTVSKVHIKVDNQLALDKDLKGANPVVFEATSTGIATYHGETYNVNTLILPESASEEEDCDVMIEFLGSSDNVLYHYERTIKVKANRCTNLTGAYFSDNLNLVSANTTWDSQLDTDLFPSE